MKIKTHNGLYYWVLLLDSSGDVTSKPERVTQCVYGGRFKTEKAAHNHYLWWKEQHGR